MTILGATYTDKVTGFKGIATGIVTYLTGCNQVLLNPKVDAQGKLQDAQWFDQQRLDLGIEDVVTTENGETPGCDKSAPRKN